MEYAVLKKADLQGRATRKWIVFNHMMRVARKEDRVSFLGPYGMDDGLWSDQDFPVTPKTLKYFLWWLAIPSVGKDPHTDPLGCAKGPHGHSYTYMRVLTYNLLSFVEEKEGSMAEKGNFVGGGDVSVLRRDSSLVMKSIAL